MSRSAHKRMDDEAPDKNEDPLTGAPGAHPVGAGAGAAGGATVGAAIGAVGGPVGAAAGLVAGGVAGGLAGKAIAEKIDPTAEDAYWRINYSQRPYVTPNASYEVYQYAYRTGWEGAGRYYDRTFEDAEDDLRNDYEQSEGKTKLTWEKAKNAVRDAWDRVRNAFSDERDTSVL